MTRSWAEGRGFESHTQKYFLLNYSIFNTDNAKTWLLVMFPHFYEMLVKIGQQKDKYVFLKEEKTQVFSSSAK